MVDTLITVIEILGVASFAISGAVVAIDKEMDMFGVVILSLITSFGGGIMRDVFIGREIAFFTQLYVYVAVAVAVSLAVFAFAAIFKRWYVKEEALVKRVNNYIDALGIGAFCVSTVRICLAEVPDISPFFAISMGIIASVGGGLIRDICMRDIPFFFRKHVYALAVLAGSAFYYITVAVLFPNNDVAEIVCAILAILIVFTIRVLATVFRWNLPKAINFSRMREEQDTLDEADSENRAEESTVG